MTLQICDKKPTIVLFADSLSVCMLYANEFNRQGYAIVWVVYRNSLLGRLKRAGYGSVYKAEIGFDLDVFHKFVWWGIRLTKLSNYLRKKRLESAFIELKSKYENIVVITDTTGLINGVHIDALKVQAFHSVCLKFYMTSKLNLDYDLLLLPNHSIKNTIVQRHAVQDSSQLSVVGWPRADDFYRNFHLMTLSSKRAFMHNLGLNPDHKTIMMATTWDSFDHDNLFPKSFGDSYVAFERLCAFCYENNINFILKLHHYKAKFINNNKLRKIAGKYGACIAPDKKRCYIQEGNNNFFYIADIMIADVSGCLSDYIVLDRPIVFLEPETERCSWDKSDYPASVRPGPIVSTTNALIDSLSLYIDNPTLDQNRRNRFKDLIFPGFENHRSIETAIISIQRRFHEFENV